MFASSEVNRELVLDVASSHQSGTAKYSRTGTRRGTVRISQEQLNTVEAGTRRGKFASVRTAKYSRSWYSTWQVRISQTAKYSKLALDVAQFASVGTAKYEAVLDVASSYLGGLMIKLIKSLFIAKKTENTIAASIEIKEMPASSWWN